jgi:hypothetical protein
MTKVVLLGDSIRQIGYGPLVPSLLGKDYQVFQPEDNCRFARYLLRALFDYRNEIAGADIIQFNAGLWDVSDLFGDGIFTPEQEYKETILRVGSLLKKITPNVIFATTTPVRKENPYDTNETIDSYNRFVVPELIAMGIKINDLNALIRADIEGNIRQEDLLHLTPKGAQLAAQQTVSFIHSFYLLEKSKTDPIGFSSKNGAPI